ncbi:MAG: hypothetical protein NTX42_07210 [Methanothrix sp.]|nr:hypothetical protein [Methanothrix sp.]
MFALCCLWTGHAVGPAGPEGQEELDYGKGFRVQNLGSNAVGSLLLLADNYNHTTNDFTTEAQRTHRDF